MEIIADGSVKMHGGEMSIENELGLGIWITLFLPDPSGLKEACSLAALDYRGLADHIGATS